MQNIMTIIWIVHRYVGSAESVPRMSSESYDIHPLSMLPGDQLSAAA